MRHVNIPIFIPHLGCPNQCVFCNQRSISGVREFRVVDVRDTIDNALNTIPSDAEIEIAFFGGSFTGIDRHLMISLLEIGYSYIKKGQVSALRCSTRPDYINEEIVDILKNYGVKTVELGLQSSSDFVLKASKRGHNFEAEAKACKLIVESGMDLVGQMMIGLPFSSLSDEIETARFISRCGAKAARIYPTVVFHETELCEMTLTGEYKPLSLEDAVSRSAAVFEVFLDSNIEVIRIGLQASENLTSEDSYLAGPNHSALGELVIGEYYYNNLCKKLAQNAFCADDDIIVFVSKGSLSKAVGQNKRNKIRLSEKFKKIRFAEDDNLKEYEINVKTLNGENRCT